MQHTPWYKCQIVSWCRFKFCAGFSSLSSKSMTGNSSLEPWHGQGKQNSAQWQTRKYLSALHDGLWKELSHSFLRTFCQTLENVQSAVQAGNRQDSSCPSVQKSRRDESGLACVRVYLRTGCRLSLSVLFGVFCEFVFPLFFPFSFVTRGGEPSPVFQSLKMVMENSEFRNLTNCELGVTYFAKNDIV